MTETEQATAILAALNDALTPAVAYEYSKVPGSNGNAGAEPSKYVVIDLTRRYTDNRRGSGEVSVLCSRLGIRFVAKSTSDARNLRRLATDVLEDKILSADAGEVGPFVFESAEPLRPDADYQVAYDVFTF